MYLVLSEAGAQLRIARVSRLGRAVLCCAVLCCAVETVLPSVVLLYCAVLTGTVGLFLGVETPVTTPTGITFSMLSFFFGFSLTSLSQLQIPALKFELGTWKPS